MWFQIQWIYKSSIIMDSQVPCNVFVLFRGCGSSECYNQSNRACTTVISAAPVFLSTNQSRLGFLMQMYEMYVIVDIIMG